MRWISALIVFFFVLTTALAQPSLKNVERITISGTEYVRIKDWAPAAGLTVSWIKRDEQLLMTNRWCKIELKVKSIMSRFNGLDVRLSLPVISRGGGIYISRIDLDNTLHPLLFPPKNAANKKINVICIDPGHGGKDTGKIDKLHHEKRYTLLLAEEIAQLLKQHGLKVIFTRSRDETLGLPERTAIANRHGADLFLSLHFNAASSRSVRGAEIYAMTPAGVESSNSGPGKSGTGNYTGNQNNEKNMLLAYNVQRAMLRGTGLEDRGIKRARFEVLRSAKMPAVLIEGGFMSNPDEARKIYDPAFHKKLAKSIVDGVLAYRNIVDGNAAR
ncbi:MAG: N-acetylmuramoyl-L-alanine amidase [Verrucomicrobia bacterium]|nr:N-acetylmuramoyl-L-alanine amidase [Verrucomicrobiota bacterium]